MKQDNRSRSRSPYKRSRSRSPRRMSSRNITSKRCVVSNIPYDLKWQALKDLFRQEVGDTVNYVEVFNNPDGRPKGIGLIEFKDLDSAAKAIEKMHRYEIRDRKLIVREEREREKQQNDMMSRRYGGDGGGGGAGMMGAGPMGGGGGSMSSMMGNQSMGNMGGSGISPQILQQLGIETTPNDTVFVSNLNYKVNWRKLKDVFKLAGNVLRAEIREDEEGKSRGFGTIQFESPMEAIQAISMFNGQDLFDRAMHVKMDGQASSRPNQMDSRASLPTGLKSLGPSLQNLGGGMDMGMGSMGMGNMDSGMSMGNMGMSPGMGMTGMGGSMSGMGGSMSGMGGSMSGMGGEMSRAISAMGGGMGGGMGGAMSGMGGGMGSGMGGAMSGMGGGMPGMTGGMGTGMGMSSMGMGDSYGMSGMGTGGMGLSSMGGMGGGMGGSSMDYGRGSNDYSRGSSGGGISAAMTSKLEGMNTRPDRFTVIVKNLPYSVDWQDLKRQFQSVGDIRFAEIKSENGRSAGWGLVSFRREEDAMRAVERMNRANFDGRDIVVKMLQ